MTIFDDPLVDIDEKILRVGTILTNMSGLSDTALGQRDDALDKLAEARRDLKKFRTSRATA